MCRCCCRTLSLCVCKDSSLVVCLSLSLVAFCRRFDDDVVDVVVVVVVVVVIVIVAILRVCVNAKTALSFYVLHFPFLHFVEGLMMMMMLLL